MSISDTEIRQGIPVPLQIILYNAEAGLSGFDIVMTIDDSSVATIVKAEFPEYGLAEFTIVSENRIRLIAADIEDIVTPQTQLWVLSTVTVIGKSKGVTRIGLQIFGMDDELGDTMTPVVVTGQLTVE